MYFAYPKPLFRRQTSSHVYCFMSIASLRNLYSEQIGDKWQVARVPQSAIPPPINRNRITSHERSLLTNQKLNQRRNLLLMRTSPQRQKVPIRFLPSPNLHRLSQHRRINRSPVQLQSAQSNLAVTQEKTKQQTLTDKYNSP